MLEKINRSKGSGPGRPTARKSPYPPRKKHLIDIENLAGAALPNCDVIRRVRELYGQRPGLGVADHVVIASSHLTLLNAALGWPQARYIPRSGPDGADLALLDVIWHENIAERFTHVVIGSGDHAFAAAAAWLAAAGTWVTVVSRRRNLSTTLRLAAHEVIYIDDTEPPTAASVPYPPEAA